MKFTNAFSNGKRKLEVNLLCSENYINELYVRFISGLPCAALRATLKPLYAAAVTSVNLVDNLYANFTLHLLMAA